MFHVRVCFKTHKIVVRTTSPPRSIFLILSANGSHQTIFNKKAFEANSWDSTRWLYGRIIGYGCQRISTHDRAMYGESDLKPISCFPSMLIFSCQPSLKYAKPLFPCSILQWNTLFQNFCMTNKCDVYTCTRLLRNRTDFKCCDFHVLNAWTILNNGVSYNK